MLYRERETTTTTVNGGVGFVGLLTILFVGLKLTNFIDWSWWWVLSPILFSVGLWFFIMIMILVAIVKGGRY